MTLFEELKDISAVVFTDWWSGKISTGVGICAEDGGAQTLFFPTCNPAPSGTARRWLTASVPLPSHQYHQ